MACQQEVQACFGPKAHGPPCWGGGIQSREARGEVMSPIPPMVGDPPRMAPPESRGSIWENTASQSLVVLGYDHFLHDYFSN